jgi:hypothetical protein
MPLGCSTVSALERNVSMTKDGRHSSRARKRRASGLMPRTLSYTCPSCGTALDENGVTARDEQTARRVALEVIVERSGRRPGLAR